MGLKVWRSKGVAQGMLESAFGACKRLRGLLVRSLVYDMLAF